MNEVGAIVLAAGLSRRMVARNKLLLPVGGVPMIRHTVDTYSAVSVRPVLVVTGYAAEDIEVALAGSSARTVFNPDFAQGRSTSVVCGLRAVAPATDVLIGLGDQPLLTPADLRALLAAHRGGDPARISIPVREQKRGNPIVVPASLRTKVLSDPASPGCKKFTRAHPEHVRFLALPNAGFYTDIDTPDEYEALQQESRAANA